MNAREFRIGDLCELVWSCPTLAVVIDNRIIGANIECVKVYDSDPQITGSLVARVSMLEVLAR